MPRIDVMFGPQCSGKTTLAEDLFGGHEYVSLGKEVRGTDSDSPRRREADRLIADASPWPPQLGLSFIKNSLTRAVDLRRNTLLDGYPRHVAEFVTLTAFLEDNKMPNISSIIEVTADKDVLWGRYTARESRGENAAFFELRYHQYLELREAMQVAASGMGVNYYVVDTSC